MSAAQARWSTQALRALVQAHQVHREVYVDADLFALEMERLWGRTWLFVGHTSQVPQTGDFITAQLGTQPVLLLRQADGGVKVLLNRCAHRGAQLTLEAAGNMGRTLRCPYHAWSYRLDGSLLGIALREGYQDPCFAGVPAAKGLSPYGEVAVHRGFVFARQVREGDAAGISFEAWAGEQIAALDLLADRSPRGELRVAGGVLRTIVRANWKIYLENINDALHPVSAHQSTNDAAHRAWSAQPEGSAVPLAVQQLLPFGSGHEFFQRMGGRVLRNGHSILGTQYSIHTGAASLPGYAEQLRAAHGEARAQQVLSFTPQNVVFYPAVALKGAPQVLRVIRPLAVNRTLIEAWAFEPIGAPPELLEGALTYNRSVFSPTSIVAADDLHLFESVQRGLAAQANPWVSLHREARVGTEALPRDVSGIDEALLRNQYRAWVDAMAH